MDENIKGLRPSMSEACRAMCFDCTANFADKRRDCMIVNCPLYQRMPYRKNANIRYDWIFGKWNRQLIVQAEELGITDPKEFAMHKWGKNGKIRIPMSKLFRAKCFRCCADYYQGKLEKGRVDCGVASCPIYYWTPYRQQLPNYDWMFELDYTRKHRLALSALGYTKEEYVHHLLEEKDI
jgi:hypothetical protein